MFKKLINVYPNLKNISRRDKRIASNFISNNYIIDNVDDMVTYKDIFPNEFYKLYNTEDIVDKIEELYRCHNPNNLSDCYDRHIIYTCSDIIKLVTLIPDTYSTRNRILDDKYGEFSVTISKILNIACQNTSITEESLEHLMKFNIHIDDSKNPLNYLKNNK